MVEFSLSPTDMASASSATSDAAREARGADGTTAMSTLAGALPGSTTARIAPELAVAWHEGISQWSDDVEEMSHAINLTTKDATGVDEGSKGRSDGLRGRVGGPR